MGIAIFLLVIAAVAGVVWTYMQMPQFGREAKGKRLERIHKSPNYRDGAFQNLHNTPMLAEDASYWTISWKFFSEAKRPLPRLFPCRLRKPI